MLKTNASKLVRIAVEGKVAPALVWPNEVGHDGTGFAFDIRVIFMTVSKVLRGHDVSH